jgi:hypothetical protein
MSFPIAALIRRHMRHTSPGAFVPAAAEPVNVDLELQPDEELVGVYRDPTAESKIYFTTSAFYCVVDGAITKVPFDSIQDFERPSDKASVEGLMLATTNGPRFLRAGGSFGPMNHRKDAFSLLMVVFALVHQNRLRAGGEVGR